MKRIAPTLKLGAFVVALALCFALVAEGPASNAAVPQAGTTKTGPVKPWEDLYGVTTLPDGTVFVVGSKGLLLESKDHGQTWRRRKLHERAGGPLMQDFDLYRIHFDSKGTEGWIVGEDGLILHTTDGGSSWTKQNDPSKKDLYGLDVLDDQHVYTVGADGEFISTQDGGKTWTAVKPAERGDLFDVYFSDPNDGFVIGEFQTIRVTSDAGKTWKDLHRGDTTDYTVGPYFGIVFQDPQHGYIAGQGGDLLTTSDSGKTWQKQKPATASAVFAIAIDNGKLWMVGQRGLIAGGTPGGEWQIQNPSFNDLSDIAFDGKYGFAVGLGATLLRTDDSGTKWQAVK